MNARNQGVEFDVFGESCYTAYQGRPSAWRSTFTQLSDRFPQLKFVIAEYGPEQRAANDVIFDLPDQRGLGTFNWEPTHPGRLEHRPCVVRRRRQQLHRDDGSRSLRRDEDRVCRSPVSQQHARDRQRKRPAPVYSKVALRP